MLLQLVKHTETGSPITAKETPTTPSIAKPDPRVLPSKLPELAVEVIDPSGTGESTIISDMTLDIITPSRIPPGMTGMLEAHTNKLAVPCLPALALNATEKTDTQKADTLQWEIPSCPRYKELPSLHYMTVLKETSHWRRWLQHNCHQSTSTCRVRANSEKADRSISISPDRRRWGEIR